MLNSCRICASAENDKLVDLFSSCNAGKVKFCAGIEVCIFFHDDF